MKKKLAITIISGFLGAGKTTLVNHLLSHRGTAAIGVIVNEFGDIGIDGELIIEDATSTIEIRNGCVCCTVRTDLVSAIKQLLERAELSLDRIIIETSGLADPAPVLQTLLLDADLLASVELEAVITVVDALQMAQQLDSQIAREQVAFADLIVLNKMDLLPAEHHDERRLALKAINPTAELIETRNAQVDPLRLLGTKRFSVPHLLLIEPTILEDEHAHEHDESISSFALQSTAAIDPNLFAAWSAALLDRSGADLLRMKGILHFDGNARQFYFHSVHQHHDCKPGKPWRGEQRDSRMVFIGRNLDREALRTGFIACQVASQSAALSAAFA